MHSICRRLTSVLFGKSTGARGILDGDEVKGSGRAMAIVSSLPVVEGE